MGWMSRLGSAFEAMPVDPSAAAYAPGVMSPFQMAPTTPVAPTDASAAAYPGAAQTNPLAGMGNLGMGLMQMAQPQQRQQMPMLPQLDPYRFARGRS